MQVGGRVESRRPSWRRRRHWNLSSGWRKTLTQLKSAEGGAAGGVTLWAKAGKEKMCIGEMNALRGRRRLEAGQRSLPTS